MIRPYTGSINKEIDEAVDRAEAAGLIVIPMEEPIKKGVAKLYFLTARKAEGVQVSEVEILTTTGFLQTFGRH